MKTQKSSLLLFVGTYTRSLPHVDGAAAGIHVLHYYDGRLVAVTQDLPMGDGPSYLAVMPTDRSGDVCVVACNEGDPDQLPGTLTVQHVRVETAEAVTIRPTGPAEVVDVGSATPCHVATAGDRPTWLAVATYFGGGLSLHRVTAQIADDGSQSLVVGAVSDAVVLGAGSGVNADRQDKGHAHHVLFARSRGQANAEHLLFLCDLGSDSVHSYRVLHNGKLQRLSNLATPPGSGPRHAVEHPSLPWVFILCELSNDALCCSVDDESGVLTPRATVSVLRPSDASGYVAGNRDAAGSAAIRTNTDGSLIFASVRGQGHNYVTVLAFVVTPDGRPALSPIGFIDGFGACPRDIVHHPAEPVLFVASQNDHRVTAFRYSAKVVEGGTNAEWLCTTEGSVSVKSPVCLAVVEC